MANTVTPAVTMQNVGALACVENLTPEVCVKSLKSGIYNRIQFSNRMVINHMLNVVQNKIQNRCMCMGKQSISL